MKSLMMAVLAFLLVACGSSTTIMGEPACSLDTDCNCPDGYEPDCESGQCLCLKENTTEVTDICEQDTDCSCPTGYLASCQEDGLCYCQENGPSECYPLWRARFIDQLVRKLIDLDSYTPPATPTFNDVPEDHYYFAAIEAAAELGIISANQPDGNFRPEDSLNRAEGTRMVILAIDGLNGYTPPEIPDFEDVSPEEWYFDYVEAAFQLGLVEGYVTFDGLPTGFFGPGDVASSCFMNEMMAHAKLP